MTQTNIDNYSLATVFKVSLPIIFSIFGWTLMITVDRLMLSYYDIEVMNGVVAVGIIFLALEYAVGSIAVTSEIFAGQYNGLGNKEMAPVASWQMLILTLLSSIPYCILGLFSGKYIIPSEYYDKVNDFYTIIVCFLFILPSIGAINGFFIGIKKTNIILINTIIGNTINIFLSYCLIFGVENYIDPMGAKGAAIANVISIAIQFVIIFSIFLSKKFHNEYKTRNFFFSKEIFLKCINIGVPSSLALQLEMLGNFAVQMIIIKMLFEYVSNHNIAVNIFIFFTFMINGLHKAVSGLSANLIGARDFHLIPKLLKSAIIAHIVSSIFVFIPTIICPGLASKIYTSNKEIIDFSILTLPWVFLYYFFDGFGWIYASITTSGGDTKFLMFASIVAIWLFKVLPLYLLLKAGIKYISLGWIVSAVSALVYALSFYYRYHSNRWLKLKLS